MSGLLRKVISERDAINSYRFWDAVIAKRTIALTNCERVYYETCNLRMNTEHYFCDAQHKQMIEFDEMLKRLNVCTELLNDAYIQRGYASAVCDRVVERERLLLYVFTVTDEEYLLLREDILFITNSLPNADRNAPVPGRKE